MKMLNKTILAVLCTWAVTAGAAFAKMDNLPNDFNYNIGAEQETTLAPSSLDREIVSRLCASDLDKPTCLESGLQQAIDK